jgi:uncharacterized membrane protein YcaP (DUF421 family)
MVLLRFSGRKSISQMTPPQVAVLVSIGAILGSDVGGKGVWDSILAAAIFIGFLVVSEWLSVKSNFAERVLKGFAKTVIQDGKFLPDHLRKLRMSVDDLEQRLRIDGVARVEDVKTGTIEINGELGCEFMPDARPVTIKDLKMIFQAYFPDRAFPELSSEKPTIFTEVADQTPPYEVPRYLQ